VVLHALLSLPVRRQTHLGQWVSKAISRDNCAPLIYRSQKALNISLMRR
jgi:hypothetical protein